MSSTPGAVASIAGEVTRAVAITGIACVVILLFAPPAGDAAAHLYRTYLIERHIWVWDTHWYRGSYPTFSYSLLYYPLAALVGNTPLTVAGTLAAAAIFTVIAIRQWGQLAVWPARAFGICAAGPLITGTFSYGLGLAAALGALLAAQRNRWWMVLAMAGVTLGLSPLAFAFLLLVLAAVVVARRHLGRTAAWVGGGLAVLVGLQAAAMAGLGQEGTYPFGQWSLFAVTVVAGCGVALAWRTTRTRLLAAYFALWLAASVSLYVLPSPFGETVTRLRYVVFPLMLATVLLAGWRPRWLAVTGLSVAVLYNLVPYAVGVTVRSWDSRSATSAFWQPAIEFLRAHESPDHLVEVVATESHWEAYWLPRAGIPLVRGWYRQTDIVRNDALYQPQTSPELYRTWLDRNAVRYVVLPNVRFDVFTGVREAELVRSPRTGLKPVMRTPDLTTYEVPHAGRLLTGPGQAGITKLDHEQVTGWLAAPGRYQLRLQWTPYWRIVPRGTCLGSSRDGTIELRAARPGPFRLTIDRRPDAVAAAVASPARRRPAACES